MFFKVKKFCARFRVHLPKSIVPFFKLNIWRISRIIYSHTMNRMNGQPEFFGSMLIGIYA